MSPGASASAASCIFRRRRSAPWRTNNVFRSRARHADGAVRGARDRAGGVRLAHARGGVSRQRPCLLPTTSSPRRTTAPMLWRRAARLDLTKRTNIEALVSHQLDKDTARRARLTGGRRRARRHRDRSRRASPSITASTGWACSSEAPSTDVDFAPVPEHRRRPHRQRRARLHSARGRLPGELGPQPQDGRVRRDRRQLTASSTPAPDDGILRSSHGERYRVGVTLRAVGRPDPRRGERRLGPAAPQ